MSGCFHFLERAMFSFASDTLVMKHFYTESISSQIFPHFALPVPTIFQVIIYDHFPQEPFSYPKSILGPTS